MRETPKLFSSETIFVELAIDDNLLSGAIVFSSAEFLEWVGLLISVRQSIPHQLSLTFPNWSIWTSYFH